MSDRGIFLKLKDDSIIHLSHFHNYVSAYETNKENVKWLSESIVNAIKSAKQSGEAVMVDQDNLTHIFVVNPSGSVDLYRRVGSYDVVSEDGLEYIR